MDEKDIIDLYFARNEEAIRETDYAFGDAIRSLSYRILQTTEDSEENLNDTCMTAWRTIPPVRPFSLRAYLLKICRRKALDRLNTGGPQKQNEELAALTEEMENCIPDSRLKEQAEKIELSRLINHFLGTLSVERRDILIARYFCLESIPEIAGDFGYSETRIRFILFRVRKSLKKTLESEGILI